MPYNFGPVTQLINEIYQYDTFNTGSVRNIYSPDVVTAIELMVDQVAKAMGQDPYKFRRSFLRDPRLAAVLDKVARGRKLGPGNAFRNGPGDRDALASTRAPCAFLVEIDCTSATVNRKIR